MLSGEDPNILFIIAAGILNGSFVIPARFTHLKQNIWFYHAIIGLLLIPWVLLFIINPHLVQLYTHLNLKTWLILLAGGACFGFGQICFFNAIEKIGIGLAFTINIGLGVIIGSLYSVFIKHLFFSSLGLTVTAAVLIILTSLVINYLASNHHTLSDHYRANYKAGWLLGMLAGMASGLQNITFVCVLFPSHLQQNFHANGFWIWPPFLAAAAIVMLIKFYEKSAQTRRDLSIKNTVLITTMGLFFTGSLALYSKGMSQLGETSHAIGWPIFMIIIILTCRFWGKIYDKLEARSNKKLNIISIFLLLIAILLLASTR